MWDVRNEFKGISTEVRLIEESSRQRVKMYMKIRVLSQQNLEIPSWVLFSTISVLHIISYQNELKNTCTKNHQGVKVILFRSQHYLQFFP